MITSVLCTHLDHPVWRQPAPGACSLDDSVHLWRIRITEDAETLSYLGSQLDKEERQKASCFRHEADTHRYILGHGMLRELARLHFGMTLAEMVMKAGPNG